MKIMKLLPYPNDILFTVQTSNMSEPPYMLSTHIYGIRGRNTPHQISLSFFSGNRASTLSRLRIISLADSSAVLYEYTQHKPNLDALRMNICEPMYPYAMLLRVWFSRRLYAEESARLSASENRFQ